MKIINISKNKVVLIDDADFERINSFKWTAANCPTNSSYYAQRRGKNKEGKLTTIKMHRFIMDCPKGLQVDHINGNTLDNRRENLRITTGENNSRNRAHQKNARFPYKGVFLRRDRKTVKYGARITYKATTMWLGSFKTIEEAAEAYNAAAIKYFGEYAKLNIIKP